MRSSLYIAFITALLSISSAQAEDMELTADNRVEWHQKEQLKSLPYTLKAM